MAETGTSSPHGLRRELGFRDVVLFLITAGVNLQWVATAAAAGPSSLVVWIAGCAGMTLPLAACVVDLSSRYPDEGGLYVWSRRGFGEFAAFLAGWTCWMSNLPYFPGVLYFAAGNLLYAGGDRFRHLSGSPAYYLSASILGLLLATGLNVVGVGTGKRLTNLGAHARWLAGILLVGIGLAAFLTAGPATSFAPARLVPGFRVADMIFWSAIAFALTGLEAASLMGDEVKDARRTVPRAVFVTAPIILLIYLAGTTAVLVALPAGEVSGVQGLAEAMSAAGRRLGLDWMGPIGALLVTISALGSVGAWFGAMARLPFVAGIDHFLPAAFARVHPRFRTPHVALIAQGLAALACVVLGQAGTSVKGAYEVLVSMSVISYMIPFLFLFASAIRAQRQPPGPEVVRLPGGRPALVVLGALGFITTLAALVLAFVPAPDEPNKPLAVLKIAGLTAVMLGSGVAVFLLRRRTRCVMVPGP